MNHSNGIALAVNFYRRQQNIPSFGWVLAVSGISGVLETLPILLSLPLIRTLFLNTEQVFLGSIHVEVVHYVLALLVLLLLRLFVGIYSQFLNASTRIQLLAHFRANSPQSERQRLKTVFGKSVQSINFLLVGWSQLLPGLLFSGAGIALFPEFGGIILGILLLWLVPMRVLKNRQDQAHEHVSTLQSALDENESITIDWRDARYKAARLDSVNKNLREFIIVSTLIVALFLSHALGLSFSDNSLLVILMLLRGMQQLFTAYIMAQQVSALRGFLKEFTH